MKMRKVVLSAVLIMVLFVFGCANMGATNTSVPNVGVTSYESLGLTLTKAYNTEKALYKAGKISDAQDKEFQLGVYTKAYDSYIKVGEAMKIIFSVSDTVKKAQAQDAFKVYSTELPGLIADVVAFVEALKK